MGKMANANTRIGIRDAIDVSPKVARLEQLFLALGESRALFDTLENHPPPQTTLQGISAERTDSAGRGPALSRDPGQPSSACV